MKKYITWEKYIEMCNNLAQKIKHSKITDIVGVSRGGLIPAQIISYQCNICRVHNFGIHTYSKNDERLSDAMVSFYQQTTMRFGKEHSVLIVDDIADSGRTLKIVAEHINNYSTETEIYTATLHYKEMVSILKPTYFIENVLDDEWIVYPYDID